MKSRAGTQSRPSGCWQSQQTAKVMRKPASQESKSAGKGSCLNASDRRVQVQLAQEAKIVPGFPSCSGNFCVCRLRRRPEGRAQSRPCTRLSNTLKRTREGGRPFRTFIVSGAHTSEQGNFCIGKVRCPERKSYSCNFCLRRVTARVKIGGS